MFIIILNHNKNNNNDLRHVFISHLLTRSLHICRIFMYTVEWQGETMKCNFLKINTLTWRTSLIWLIKVLVHQNPVICVFVCICIYIYIYIYIYIVVVWFQLLTFHYRSVYQILFHTLIWIKLNLFDLIWFSIYNISDKSQQYWYQSVKELNS